MGAQHSVFTRSIALKNYNLMQSSKFHQVDCHISILNVCLGSEWMALNASFFSLCYLMCSSSMNSPAHNGSDSPLLTVYNTALITKIWKYIWYYSWQVSNVCRDEDWSWQNLWAGRKKATATRRAPATLSEHSRTNVESKMESDIGQPFFSAVTWKSSHIPLNKGEDRKTHRLVSSNLIKSK